MSDNMQRITDYTTAALLTAEADRLEDRALRWERATARPPGWAGIIKADRAQVARLRTLAAAMEAGRIWLDTGEVR